jgi:hypothetical protein
MNTLDQIDSPAYDLFFAHAIKYHHLILLLVAPFQDYFNKKMKFDNI